MGNPVDGTKGKLGRGFMSADKLEEIDVVMVLSQGRCILVQS